MIFISLLKLRDIFSGFMNSRQSVFDVLYVTDETIRGFINLRSIRFAKNGENENIANKTGFTVSSLYPILEVVVNFCCFCFVLQFLSFFF